MTGTSSRVAIVTRGSRGIGRAAAERLGADGFAVVVNYAGNKTEADAAVEVIESRGARAIAVQADVADEVAVSAVFDAAEEAFGGVDVVVHAAGIMALGMVADMDLEVFDRQVRTNLRGTFVVDQQAARRVRCGGAIINFSSSVLALQAPT
jgi:3-oxoacyl-[acyl-carrier protein] reductase